MTDISKETIDTLTGLAVAGKTIALIDGTQGVVLPAGDDGYKLEIIKPVDAPLSDHIRQAVTFDTDDSLIEYVGLFQPDAAASLARLFAKAGSRPSATVVFDYHSATFGKPGRLNHRAFYPMPWSPQWKRWTEICSSAVSQGKLLEFIEENGEDIRQPMAVELAAILGSISSRKKVDFKSGYRLSDGSMELSYVEENETSGGSKSAIMPSEMLIGIPVFLEGPPYEVKVFIRYRINDGKLTFQLVMHRTEFVIEDATKLIVQKIEHATGLSALWGSIGGKNEYGRETT